MLETGTEPLEAHTVTILEELDGIAIDSGQIGHVLERVGTAARSLVPGFVGLTIRLDNGTTQKWPPVNPFAQTAGAGRTIEVHLGDGTGDTGGVLELQLDSADSEATHATALVELVSLAVSSSTQQALLEARIEQLGEAVETRDIIGQAKGIIMARKGCDPIEAFDVLRRASQRTQRKLRDLAAEVVASVSPPATS